MTFKCFEKVLYNGKEVTIVGVTRRGASRYGSGITYDVRVDGGRTQYDYKNVPEKHLKAIEKPQTNEVLDMVKAANKLKNLRR